MSVALAHALEDIHTSGEAPFWRNFEERVRTYKKAATATPGQKTRIVFDNARESSWPLAAATLLVSSSTPLVVAFDANDTKRAFLSAFRTYVNRVVGARVETHVVAHVHSIFVRTNNVESVLVAASGDTGHAIDGLVTVLVVRPRKNA